MRILIHGLNFAPELAGVGKYTGELAEWLAQHGHEVRVVTAYPYYPAWRIAEGYPAWRYSRDICFDGHQDHAPGKPSEFSGKAASGVTVFRCPLWVPSRPSGWKRLLHLASFALSSLPVMLAQVFWKPDLVLAIEPPLLCAPQAWLTARSSGAIAWLHIQDFEVDAAFDLGLFAPGVLRAIGHTGERALLRRFDRVSTISDRMLAGLEAKAVPASRRVAFPNWVDPEAIFPLEGPSSFRAELGIPNEAVVVLYSGSIGEKQGLKVMVEVAQELRFRNNIYFVICGEGSGRAELMDSARSRPNVYFVPFQPVARLNDLLNLADVHLLPQRADIADRVMPSKLTGMFASGRPVVATALADSQLAMLVEGRGLVVPPGDASAIAAGISHLAADSGLREKLGREARAYAVSAMARDEVLRQFESEVMKCIRERRGEGENEIDSRRLM